MNYNEYDVNQRENYHMNQTLNDVHPKMHREERPKMNAETRCWKCGGPGGDHFARCRPCEDAWQIVVRTPCANCGNPIAGWPVPTGRAGDRMHGWCWGCFHEDYGCDEDLGCDSRCEAELAEHAERRREAQVRQLEAMLGLDARSA